jgi:hypothetical protein
VALLQKDASGDFVSREWEGQTVVCIASGPSLTQKQVELARAFKTIAVNDNYLIAPWADVLYFADHKWWVWHRDGVEKSWAWAKFAKAEVAKAFAEFKGQMVSIRHNPQAKDGRVFFLRNDGTEGLCESPTGIRTGNNSGYQALNIAFLSGAKRILLLGYDMTFDGKRSHSHNGHVQHTQESAYHAYAKRFNTMQIQLNAKGVEVINCSHSSKINCFKKEPIESIQPATAGAVVQTASV